MCSVQSERLWVLKATFSVLIKDSRRNVGDKVSFALNIRFVGKSRSNNRDIASDGDAFVSGRVIGFGKSANG